MATKCNRALKIQQISAQQKCKHDRVYIVCFIMLAFVGGWIWNLVRHSTIVTWADATSNNNARVSLCETVILWYLNLFTVMTLLHFFIFKMFAYVWSQSTIRIVWMLYCLLYCFYMSPMARIKYIYNSYTNNHLSKYSVSRLYTLTAKAIFISSDIKIEHLQSVSGGCFDFPPTPDSNCCNFCISIYETDSASASLVSSISVVYIRCQVFSCD